MKKSKKDKFVECTAATSSHMRGTPKYTKPKKLKGWMQFKSYRLGRKAALRGLPRTSCPYQLTEDMIKILLLRDKWMRGYEEFSMTPKAVKAYGKRVDAEHKAEEEKHKKKGK